MEINKISLDNSTSCKEGLDMIKQAVATMAEKDVNIVISSSMKPDSAIKRNITTTPNYPAYEEIRKVISDERNIVYICGDGNCLFCAVDKVISDSENGHEELRKLLVDSIKDNVENGHEELRKLLVDSIKDNVEKLQQFIDGIHDNHISRMYQIGT